MRVTASLSLYAKTGQQVTADGVIWNVRQSTAKAAIVVTIYLEVTRRLPGVHAKNRDDVFTEEPYIDNLYFHPSMFFADMMYHH